MEISKHNRTSSKFRHKILTHIIYLITCAHPDDRRALEYCLPIILCSFQKVYVIVCLTKKILLNPNFVRKQHSVRFLFLSFSLLIFFLFKEIYVIVLAENVLFNKKILWRTIQIIKFFLSVLYCFSQKDLSFQALSLA